MNRGRVILIVLGCLVLGGVLIWVWRTFGAALQPEVIRSWLGDLGPWGPLFLIAALAGTLVIPVVPATILQVGAGLAFGPVFGLVYVLVADALGATAGFWLARRWGRTLLDTRLSAERKQQIVTLSQRIDWKAVMLLRLLPGPAYPLISFAAGYAPISFRLYLLSSLAGVAPALALLAFAGDLVTRSPVLAFALVVAFVGSLALAGKLMSRKTLQQDDATAQ
jgi:uncharacterized membrane protein YdjX (TVP38/TMEM64 family)